MKIVKIIFNNIGEAIIIFALVFCINNYFGNQKQLLNADGKGYYDYLPSLFIYADLPSFNKKDKELATVSERINKTDFYVWYKKNRVNKYPCGEAILLFPAFVYAHLTAPLQGFVNDGFSEPYQRAIFYAAIIYLFFTLVFLRRLLSLYGLQKSTIFIVQIFVVFSTSVINYVYADPAFSHIYSFFSITAFLFFTKSFFLKKQIKNFLWACAFLGLIVILRQINIIVVLFIPFLAGSFDDLKSGIEFLFKNKKDLIKGIFIFLLIVCIQLYLWHLQTGEYFVYSYQGESFDFFHPHFFDILFSYRKGLFIYTPILFFAFFGLYFFIKERKIYLLFTWVLFFLLITYILSSWYCWDFGMSYGLRAYIDYYALFCITLAILIEKIRWKPRIALILIMCLTIPLNCIQTWQYRRYILHWNDMNKQKYWDVFLKTDNRFCGYLWKKKYDFNKTPAKIIYEKSLGTSSVLLNSTKEIDIDETKNISNFNDVNLIQLRFDNVFKSDDDGHIEFFIVNAQTGKAYIAVGTPLIHFAEIGLNKEQSGSYIYELPHNMEKENMKVYMKIVATNKSIELKNIQIKFLKCDPIITN